MPLSFYLFKYIRSITSIHPSPDPRYRGFCPSPRGKNYLRAPTENWIRALRLASRLTLFWATPHPIARRRTLMSNTAHLNYFIISCRTRWKINLKSQDTVSLSFLFQAEQGVHPEGISGLHQEAEEGPGGGQENKVGEQETFAQSPGRTCLIK